MRSKRKSRCRTNRALIDALEPRWLFVTFNGTASSDLIEIAKVSFPAGTRVTINGVSNTTISSTITINALGGNDLIDVSGMDNGANITDRKSTRLNSSHRT